MVNLDEFLKDLEAVPMIGWENKRKLIALVRKLREQRDKSTMAWANCKDYIHDKGAALIAADNDELDRIVRGG